MSDEDKGFGGEDGTYKRRRVLFRGNVAGAGAGDRIW